MSPGPIQLKKKKKKVFIDKSGILSYFNFKISLFYLVNFNCVNFTFKSIQSTFDILRTVDNILNQSESIKFRPYMHTYQFAIKCELLYRNELDYNNQKLVG